MSSKFKIISDNYYIATGKVLNENYKTDSFSEASLFFPTRDFAWLQKKLYEKFQIVVSSIEDHLLPDDQVYTEFMIIN